jgi:hypothetical protein
MKAQIIIIGEVFSVRNIRLAFAGTSAEFFAKKIPGHQSYNVAEFNSIAEAQKCMAAAHRNLKEHYNSFDGCYLQYGRVEAINYDAARATIERL